MIPHKTIARRVDWASNEDFRCAFLGSIGLSTKCITRETGLTPCQVSYRLNRGGIRRMDFRNGVTKDGKACPYTRLALTACEHAITPKLRRQLAALKP